MAYDLHMHSTASDGTDAPGDLARLVKDAGLLGFALTDHDTTSGLEAAAKAAKRLRLKFVPGIELSADPGSIAPPQAGGSADGTPSVGTLHLLGYHIRHDDAGSRSSANACAPHARSATRRSSKSSRRLASRSSTTRSSPRRASPKTPGATPTRSTRRA